MIGSDQPESIARSTPEQANEHELATGAPEQLDAAAHAVRASQIEAIFEAMAEALALMPDNAVDDAAGARMPHWACAVAERLAELTRRLLGCRCVSISTLDSETGELYAVAVVGLTPEDEYEWRRRVARLDLSDPRIDPLLIPRLHAGKALVLDLAQPPFDDLAACYGAAVVLAAPIRVEARLVGILKMDYGAAPHDYTAHDMALAGAAATLAAMVIERARLLRQRAETTRLKEIDRLRADFIATVSHDLRTPLTAAQAGLGMLETRLRDRLQPDERDLLANAHRNIRRLGLLIDDLLAINQLEAGTLRVQSGALDLRAVVTDALPAVQPLLREKGQTLQLDLPEPLPVRGDRRLEQVVVNLLANAHHHTPAGTHIAVSGQVRDDHIMLSVGDDGPGIPAAELEDIFLRFHRLDATNGGAGLGLAIARGIVELHEGRIWVESSPEAGAIFHVVLPRLAE